MREMVSLFAGGLLSTALALISKDFEWYVPAGGFLVMAIVWFGLAAPAADAPAEQVAEPTPQPTSMPGTAFGPLPDATHGSVGIYTEGGRGTIIENNYVAGYDSGIVAKGIVGGRIGENTIRHRKAQSDDEGPPPTVG